MTNASLTSEIARSRDELDQPSVSARLLEPFTRQLLSEAGLGPGMRVLDVCSGAGELALLARDIVGPGGHVTGFDPAAQAVAYASDRAAFRGLNNVDFVQAEFDDLPFAAEFDAIIGRVVLAYRRDPVRDLRALARCGKPGGLLVFQEFDHLSGRTIPPAARIEEIRHWMIEAFERAGIDLQMGPRLYTAFQSAGLPPPRMRLDGLIGGAESVAPMLMETVMRMLLPHLESLGVAAGQDVVVDTLEERIRLDLERSGGILQSSLLVGAWARIPD
jgi:ubiquinone/menaquinone biosynthesis C-methylase UbiE